MPFGFVGVRNTTAIAFARKQPSEINRPNLETFLQTPPFPEYPSGHSTVSSTAAVILTHFIGENFSYVDTVETRYGIEARPFKSFNQAAEEASISRFYGEFIL